MRATTTLAVFLMSACTVGTGGPPSDLGPGGSGSGGGGGSTDDSALVPTITVSATPAIHDLSLGQNGTTEITVSSVDGYVGQVAVDVTGALGSWSVTVVPEVLTLTAGGTATATVTVDIPTDAEASDAGTSLQLVATPLEEARDLSLAQNVDVLVENTYYAQVASGTGEGAHSLPIVAIRLGAAVEL